MEICIYIVSFLILLSKFMDCYTTSIQIVSISQERNPLARIFMKTFGVQTTIWGIFVLSIIIVSVTVYLLFTYFNTTFYKTLFIITGLLISFAQFAVAHTNKTQRLNVFTKLLLNVYRKFNLKRRI